MLANFFEQGGEQRPLPRWRRLRHEDDKARVRRLTSIQATKIDSVVGEEHEFAPKDPRDQVVILGRGQTEKVDVVSLMPRRVADFGQGRVQTFVDQKPQSSATAARATFARGSPGMARRCVEITLKPKSDNRFGRPRRGCAAVQSRPSSSFRRSSVG